MAITSYVGNQIVKETNTFEDWLARTNTISADMGTVVVTLGASANNTGNVSITGSMSASGVIATPELRGGTLAAPGNILVSSNTTFQGTSLEANTSTYVVKSPTYIISSNTTTSSGNTMTYNTTTVNFNGNTVNYNGNNVTYNAGVVTFDSGDLVITGNTNFTANTVNLNDLVVEGSLTIANGASFTIAAFELLDAVTISANLTINGTTTANTITAQDVTSENVTANTFSINTITSNVSILGTTTANNITANTVTAVDFNSTSDISLKDNVNTLTNSIDLLKQINPVSFTWKDSGRGAYGVIAQEIEKVLPEIVSENEGIKSVAYIQIIAFLIGAVQEQQREIDEIKSRL